MTASPNLFEARPPLAPSLRQKPRSNFLSFEIMLRALTSSQRLRQDLHAIEQFDRYGLLGRLSCRNPHVQAYGQMKEVNLTLGDSARLDRRGIQNNSSSFVVECNRHSQATSITIKIHWRNCFSIMGEVLVWRMFGSCDFGQRPCGQSCLRRRWCQNTSSSQRLYCI